MAQTAKTYALPGKKGASLRTPSAGSLLTRGIALLLGIIFIIPFYICIVTALKTPMETSMSVLALPTSFQWSNFSDAMRVSRFSRAFINSCITTFSSVFLIVLCSSMAGYIIGRHNRERIFKLAEFLYLATVDGALSDRYDSGIPYTEKPQHNQFPVGFDCLVGGNQHSICYLSLCGLRKISPQGS